MISAVFFDLDEMLLDRSNSSPERLLRATMLQMLYTIRSERQMVERLEYDLLFRWFVGLGIDDVVFDASTFSKKTATVC